MRDALGLNDPDAISEGESKREARAREAAARRELKSGVTPVCLLLACVCASAPPLRVS